MSELLKAIAERQKIYIASTTRHYRKQKGQVFTPPEVAKYMASLCSKHSGDIRILDPGAGIGILTAALCDRICDLSQPKVVSATVFETDSQITDMLDETMQSCQQALQQAGHTFRYRLRSEDFIEIAAPKLFGHLLFEEFDLEDNFTTVIMNPPYFKMRKDSDHARLMSQIVHGQPNAYAFFLALGVKLLQHGGELVAITPRSFYNGLYFRAFRQWLFSRASLEHVHLFDSRTDVFKDADVLQESVITKLCCQKRETDIITISSSEGKDIDAEAIPKSFSVEEVIDSSNNQYVIRVLTSDSDRYILQHVERFHGCFSDAGLRISTGPVVAFRAKEFLLNGVSNKHNGINSVPLLWPHNVKAFSVIWPITRKNKPECFIDSPDSLKLLIPMRNYVLMKRFSSKEERRRLTAGCILAESFDCKKIALENHLNYVYHETRELTNAETLGIAAVFNSVIIDRYFRLISGNTQVNATEIRNMPFPDIVQLAEIGERIQIKKIDNTAEIDQIVNDVLGVCSSLVSEGVA